MRRPAVDEMIQDPAAPFQALRDAIKSEIHCSLPGIVHAFDPITQTATIQPAVRTRVKTETGIEHVQLPLLANVPVFFPGGGQYALTMPIQKGDECLVVFADSCIDAWWQSGGVQNQIDMRSHDISDGYAFVGFRSRPKALPNFQTDIPTITGVGSLGGPPGKSAYELAVENGFAGTLLDWLNSLASMRVEIVSTHGTVLTDNIKQTVLSAQVWRGSVNITDQIDASRFVWTRHSRDAMADQIWNEAHVGMKSVTINTATVVYETTFQCDILEEG